MTGRALPSVLIAVAAWSSTFAVVRIEQPHQDQILYGPTKIVVSVDGEENLAEVRFYLDRYPHPICASSRPPYECEFDAGTAFQGRSIRVRALDSAGEMLGGDAVATLAFTRPERVVQATLTVPVVAVAPDGPADLSGAAWSCTYGNARCDVVRARKLYQNQQPGVSLDVLVDVSPSVHSHRAELEEALRHALDVVGPDVEVAIAQFAGVYSRLTPFTSDPSVLHDSLGKMADSVPYTCLLDSVRLSLAHLQAREGHRVLFVISDAEEYCRAVRAPLSRGNRQTEAGEGRPQEHLRSQDRQTSLMGAAPPRVNGATVERTVESSRSTGIPIYVYRVGEDPASGSTVGIFERLATQSGGRVFTRADFDGLRGALSSLAVDLESTWLVEVDLPGDAATGEDRELSLATEDRSAELRYPSYWRGGNRDSVLAAMLEVGDADARYWAASQLMGSSSRDLLDRLLDTFRDEPVAVNRLVEISAIYNMTASLLLHGGVEDQETSLAVVEQLHEIHPVLTRRLRPALEVYQKTEPPRKLRKRAYRLRTFSGDSPPGQRG